MEKTEETFDANQIYEHLKQASIRPIIRFELEKRKDISPFDMKIGGAYYLPQGEQPRGRYYVGGLWRCEFLYDMGSFKEM